MNRTKLKAQLIKHESLEKYPYKDTVGKLTIGVGRNLTDKGISEREAMMLLDSDTTDAIDDAMDVFENFNDLSDVRQRVLVDMAFNLGRTKLSEFKKMIAALKIGNFPVAAAEMVDSKWYLQVGIRGIDLETMMRTGEDVG